jgi:hypothetical protein
LIARLEALRSSFGFTQANGLESGGRPGSTRSPF